jgi:hypothetical protein
MLNFPNESRSYDATRNAVRFWGYDGALEVSFFVTEAALRHLQPAAAADETGCLRTFGSNRARVLGAAARVYSRGQKGRTKLRLGTYDGGMWDDSAQRTYRLVEGSWFKGPRRPP